jgi:hypothetical protein
MSEKRTPEEEGKNLEDFVEDMKLEREALRLGTRTRGEVQASYKLSPEQREKARALGRSVKQAYAEADAQTQAQAQAQAQTQAHEKASNVVPLRPRPRRGILAPLAAAAALLGPVGYLVLEELAPPLMLVGSAPDASAEIVEAESLRAQAAGALEAGQWARCIALLDEAQKKDPKGDEAPAVRDVRRIAKRKLGVEGGAGP